MPTQVQFRRGTTAQNAGFTGANGEISIDISKKTVVVHDGSTPGGFPLAPNTAFDVANAAFNAQNADFTLSNASYDVANAAFGKANSALANTSNVVFAGDLRVTGNVFVGTSTVTITNNSVTATSITATNLVVNGSSVPSGAVSNLAFDTANAAFGAANTIAGYTPANAAFGAANQAGVIANASFGLTNTTYAAVNSAFAVINAAFTSANNVAPQVAPAFDTANAAFGVANAAYGQANTLKTSANAYADLVGTSANNYAGVMANASNTYAASLTPNLSPPFNVANAAFDKANSANVLAFNTGVGANAYATAVGTAGNTYAATVGTNANNYSNATFVKLTAASQTITGDFSISGNLFIGGNTTAVSANNLIVNDSLIYLANNNLSDTLDIGFVGSYTNGTSASVHTGLYREHASKQYYLFQGFDADPELINDIVPYANNMVNATLIADFKTSNLTLGSANAITWITSGFGVANAAYGQANTLATSANAYAAAVGVSANAYAVTVGTSGNAFATAIGTAGNAYAQTVGTSGNNYAATVGTSSNNFAGVMANSVNTYTSATYSTLTQLGQNWAVTNSAFAAANAKVASVTGTAGQIFSSGGTGPTLNLISSGVTAATYGGGGTQVPVVTVDAFGRITSASNTTVNGMDYAYANTIWGVANAGFTVANAAFAKANAAATAASPTITGTINMQAAIANYTLTDGANIDWNLNTGQVATVTLGGNRTMNAPSNLRVGTFILHVIQDATGSRTLTWNAVFKWPAAVAPTLTTTGSRRDIISFVCDGTNLYGSFLPDVR
jgi:hypothetical protein